MVYEDIGHSNKPVGVHLVGSIPLKDAEEVFSTVAAILGDRIQRIPDGEIGERKNWIAWQHQFLEKNAALEIVPPNSRAYVARPLFKLRTKDIHFDQFGYADVAKASFAIFSQLKRAGRIPDHCRFQISLPTPLALIASFIDPQDRTAIEPAYEEGIFFEIDKIMEALPSNEIAIQWDTAIEFAML